MGCVCNKKETAIDPKNRKCSKCTKKPKPECPLTDFPYCTHVLCEACYKQLGATQTICPLKHQDNPVEMGSKSKNKGGNQSQFCSKKHKMAWKENKQKCNTCSKTSHGYKCQACKQSICTKCSQFDQCGLKCPNRHSLTWKPTITCLMCNAKSHGVVCQECKWFSCSSCANIKFNHKTCPNNHGLTWTNKAGTCMKCSSGEQKVFYCKECHLVLCRKCSGYEYESENCPNGHRTLQGSKSSCSNCGLDMLGRSCSKCSYHFCTRCDLQKYTTTNKKQVEPLQPLEIVENPLLKQSPGQSKKQPSLTQQAIDKVTLKQSMNNIRLNQKIVPGITSQDIREQIEQNPGMIELYLALASLYQQKKTFANEITIYEEAWEVEDEKDNRDTTVLLKLGKKGLERSLELNFRKYAINYLTKLIGLVGQFPNRVELVKEIGGWQIMRVEQYILLKDLQKAKMEFARLDTSSEGYKRVKALLKDAEG